MARYEKASLNTTYCISSQAHLAEMWCSQVSQLVVGSVFSLVYLMLQIQAGPFARSADDFLANLCSFALATTFVCTLMFKITTR